MIKLRKQKQQNSDLEFTLEKIQEYFHEKTYYVFEDDDCYEEKQADQLDEYNDFIEKIDRIQTANFMDVLAQDEQASRKRIERNFEILRMFDSYQQQSKETEANIKKSIEMFHEQNAQCKGATRHLKRPSRFYDELDRFEDRLMDIKQQVKDLAAGLDEMEMHFKEILEYFNDDDKMDIAVTKYGSTLIDDE